MTPRRTVDRAGAGLADPDRLASLARTDLAGTPPEPAFDRVTRLVTHALGVPVSLLSFLDGERQLVKSATGMPTAPREVPLAQSLCRHVVLSGAPLVLEDVRDDPRLSPSAAAPGVGAYAGVPLHGPGGHVVGVLCALDHEPRAWSGPELAVLTDLARGVDEVVALRTAAAEQRTALLDLSHVLRSSLTGVRLEVEDLAADAPDDVRDAVVAVAAGVAETADAAARALAAAEQTVAPVTTPDVDRLVQEVAVRARSALGRDVLVHTAGAGPVDAPPGALAQVLDGLVAAACLSGRGPVRLSVLLEPAAVRVRLQDDGALPPDVSRGLTERRDAAGAGEAVSLAERAARDLGGRLVVTSTRPTTVDVVLRRL